MTLPYLVVVAGDDDVCSTLQHLAALFPFGKARENSDRPIILEVDVGIEEITPYHYASNLGVDSNYKEPRAVPAHVPDLDALAYLHISVDGVDSIENLEKVARKFSPMEMHVRWRCYCKGQFFAV